MVENEQQFAYRRGRELNSMDAASRLHWANLADAVDRRGKRPMVATLRNENAAQAYIRAGRPISELDPDRRLAWANAATPGAAAPTAPKAQEGPTKAQLQFLGSHRSVADLDAQSLDLYTWLGSETFHDKPGEAA